MILFPGKEGSHYKFFIMKLIRFGKPGERTTGDFNRDGKRFDCSDYFSDWNRDFFINDGLGKLAGNLSKRNHLKPKFLRTNAGGAHCQAGKHFLYRVELF
jgi:hypothetical protein